MINRTIPKPEIDGRKITTKKREKQIKLKIYFKIFLSFFLLFSFLLTNLHERARKFSSKNRNKTGAKLHNIFVNVK